MRLGYTETGKYVSIGAKAIILAAGGLTKLFARNSASKNMGGDSHALALRAGANLMDMEFVQFFLTQANQPTNQPTHQPTKQAAAPPPPDDISITWEYGG